MWCLACSEIESTKNVILNNPTKKYFSDYDLYSLPKFSYSVPQLETLRSTVQHSARFFYFGAHVNIHTHTRELHFNAISRISIACSGLLGLAYSRSEKIYSSPHFSNEGQRMYSFSRKKRKTLLFSLYTHFQLMNAHQRKRTAKTIS